MTLSNIELVVAGIPLLHDFQISDFPRGNLLIGSKSGGYPWHSKEDMRYFKEVTDGHNLIVGRSTYDFHMRGKPFMKNKGRVFVLTNDLLHTKTPDSNVTFCSPRALLEYLVDEVARSLIVGGRQIYQMFLPFTSTIHLSIVDFDMLHPATRLGIKSSFAVGSSDEHYDFFPWLSVNHGFVLSSVVTIGSGADIIKKVGVYSR